MFFSDVSVVVSLFCFWCFCPFYHNSVITFWGEMFGQFEHLRHVAVISFLLQIFVAYFMQLLVCFVSRFFGQQCMTFLFAVLVNQKHVLWFAMNIFIWANDRKNLRLLLGLNHWFVMLLFLNFVFAYCDFITPPLFLLWTKVYLCDLQSEKKAHDWNWFIWGFEFQHMIKWSLNYSDSKHNPHDEKNSF